MRRRPDTVSILTYLITCVNYMFTPVISVRSDAEWRSLQVLTHADLFVMESKRSTLFTFAGKLLAFGIIAGLAATTFAADPPRAGSAPVPYGYAPNYRAIVAQNRDAVVCIAAESREPEGEQESPESNPFGDDPYFRFFRGLPGPRGSTPMRSLHAEEQILKTGKVEHARLGV